ncbi:MAG TPA: YihY/virulence factor BrkB family protein [Candidatus Saccharimonadales bacterium]|nr:YihY/virulence factor BrkB family protein [Candidatus Saccharimonadales bacterium]
MIERQPQEVPKQHGLPALLVRLDQLQQHHPWLSFAWAVQRKYSDDEAGYEGVLMTYYGFLSLFPLLFVLLSLLQLSVLQGLHIRSEAVSVINQRLPIVGTQLQANIHSRHSASIVLVVSLLITLYGARSVAVVLQHAMDRLWLTPKSEQIGGLTAVMRSLGIVVLGGLTIIAATVLSNVTTGFGHSIPARLFSLLMSLLTIFVVMLLLFRIGPSKAVSAKKLVTGALASAVGLQIIQIFGGLLVAHELRNLSSLYGSFAVALGILFWLYLQVQVLLYGVEINTVRTLGLWPRGLVGSSPTEQDREAKRLYARL